MKGRQVEREERLRLCRRHKLCQLVVDGYFMNKFVCCGKFCLAVLGRAEIEGKVFR